MKITDERWKIAQEHEFKFHEKDGCREDIRLNYERSYNIIFNYLEIDKEELKNKTILEIGPAYYPALLNVNTKESYVVEPLFDQFPQQIRDLYNNKKINVLKCMAEDLDKVNLNFDEVWIFNLLQHVQDPEKVLNNAYQHSSKVRIFEPINLPTDICHPHTFDKKYFEDMFPKTQFKVHSGGSISNFHDANCIYGTIFRE